MAISKIELFEEMLRLWQRRQENISSLLGDPNRLKLWSSDPHAVEKFYSVENYAAIINMIEQILQEEFIIFCDGLMAAFDGATELADNGVALDIVDQSGMPISSCYQSDFMEYLVSKGMQ